MGVPKVITATEQTVPVTKRVKVTHLSFVSDDEDLHVKLIDGGAFGTGTVKHNIELAATTNLGEVHYNANFGDEGADFAEGLNVNITKDGAAAAGTGNINIVYKDY